MPRFCIKIAYDGSVFHGWQIQHNAWSVQSEIEKAFGKFSELKPKFCGAGRTDTGVHALGQMASFDYDGNMSPLQILRAFNRFLPDSIKIIAISSTTDLFSALSMLMNAGIAICSPNCTPFNRCIRFAHVEDQA